MNFANKLRNSLAHSAVIQKGNNVLSLSSEEIAIFKKSIKNDLITAALSWDSSTGNKRALLILSVISNLPSNFISNIPGLRDVVCSMNNFCDDKDINWHNNATSINKMTNAEAADMIDVLSSESFVVSLLLSKGIKHLSQISLADLIDLKSKYLDKLLQQYSTVW